MSDPFSAMAWAGGGFGVLALLATPVMLYRRTVARRRASWAYVEKVHVGSGGAYRGTVVDDARTPEIPRLVRVASLWSLFMLVPAVVSLPLLALGFAYATGPSLVFGPLGVVLALLVVRAGYVLPHADVRAASFARGVAVLEIVHNLAIGITVALASGTEGAWEMWGIQKTGCIAVGYAAVSILHAVMLLSALRAHARRAARAARAEAPEPVYALGA